MSTLWLKLVKTISKNTGVFSLGYTFKKVNTGDFLGVGLEFLYVIKSRL